jgi:hypothetical protein
MTQKQEVLVKFIGGKRPMELAREYGVSLNSILWYLNKIACADKLEEYDVPVDVRERFTPSEPASD